MEPSLSVCRMMAWEELFRFTPSETLIVKDNETCLSGNRKAPDNILTVISWGSQLSVQTVLILAYFKPEFSTIMSWSLQKVPLRDSLLLPPFRYIKHLS